MTVQSEISSVTHACDGVTTAFPVPYRFLVNTDLVVTLIEPSGDEEIRTVLTLGTDYMVTGAGADAGGTITTAVDYPFGDQLEIVRDVPLTQLTEYQPSGPFPAKSHERALDKVTMITQQLDRRQMQSEADIEDLKEFDQQIGDLVQQAADSAAAAQTAAEASEAALYEFRGVYLGAQPSDPVVDLNGDPLTEGDFYFSITADRMRVYVSGAWVDAVDGVTEAQLADAGASALIGYRSNVPGSVAQTVRSAIDVTITPYTFGAVGDGVADDTAAMIAFGLAEARMKVLAPGRFRITQEVVFRPGDVVVGCGARSVIDASGAVAWPYAAVVSVSGTLTQVGNLSANVNAGEDALSLASAAGISAGDALILYNPTNASWSGWRPEYRAGEFVRVHSVSGGNVKLMACLYDSYNAVAMSVYRLDGASTVFRDFTVLSPVLEVIGVKMAMIDRPVMENVWCTGSLSTSLEFERCADIRFDGSAFQTQPATNDEYGLMLANCHGGLVTGASLNAGRHGLAIGGYDRVGCVSSRAITVQVARMGNNAPAGAQDMHGNAEDFRFFGGTFQNGGVIGGQNHKFFGCRFVGRQSGGGVALYAGELRGGAFEFSSCTFESITNPNAGGYGIVSLGNLTANTRAPCKFIFNDCTFKAPGSTRYAVGLAINGASFSPTVLFHNVDLEAGGLTQFLRLSRDAGVSTVARVAIQGIYNLAAGAAYVVNAGTGLTVSRYSLPRQGGAVSVAGVTGSNNANASVTFNHPYPVTPSALSYKASGTTLGGAAFIPDVQGVTATAMTVNGTTASGSNFPNTSAGTIGWEVFIDQH